jgi:hypothetical protein
MSRTVTILSGILIVQIILLGILSVDTHRVTKKENFLANDTSHVDYIHIKNEDGELTLKRIGAGWKVTNPFDYPANPSYVNTLLKKLDELQKESVITSNKSKWNQYELDDSTTAYVEVGVEGGTIDKFYCGKPSDSYSHTYMRYADSDEVHLVSGTPRSSFTRRPNDWRNKSVLAIDKSMLERVVLTFPDERVELVREISSPLMDTTLVSADTTWKVIPKSGRPFAPDDKTLNRVLNTLKRLNATDFMDAGTDDIPSFDQPDLTVQIYREGDQVDRIDFVPEPDSDSRWVVRKNNDEKTIFVVYKSSYNNLSKRAADLMPKEEDES